MHWQRKYCDAAIVTLIRINGGRYATVTELFFVVRGRLILIKALL
jgi:hypothetical protein